MIHIVLIYNSKDQLVTLKSTIKTFLSPQKYSITTLDNSQNNHITPYALLSNLPAHIPGITETDYILYCHQDIEFTATANHEKLWNLIQNLDQTHPKWAIAGPAGISDNFQYQSAVIDRFKYKKMKSTLVKAISLDECFLLLNPKNFKKYVSNFASFHLYGSDICLHAISQNYEAYIINFPIVHKGEGNVDNTYFETVDLFTKKWKNTFGKAIYYNSVGTILLTPKKYLQIIFSNKIIFRIFLKIARSVNYLRYFSPYHSIV